MQRKLLGIINVDFDTTGQLPIIHSVFVKYMIRKWEYIEAAYQLFIYFKKSYYSVSRKVLYNIPIKFGISIKPVRLIKMCLNEKYSKNWVGKNLSDMLPIRNGFKKGDALSPLLLNSAL
jgi:hypothetical protein